MKTFLLLGFAAFAFSVSGCITTDSGCCGAGASCCKSACPADCTKPCCAK